MRICRAGTCLWSRLALEATEERAAAIALQLGADGCVQPFVAGDLGDPDQLAWRPAADAECFPAGLASQGLAALGDPDPQPQAATPAVASRSALFVLTRVRTSAGLRTVGAQDLHGTDDGARS